MQQKYNQLDQNLVATFQRQTGAQKKHNDLLVKATHRDAHAGILIHTNMHEKHKVCSHTIVQRTNQHHALRDATNLGNFG